MITMVRTEIVQIQEPGASLGSSTYVQGPKHLSHSLLLDGKYSSQDLEQVPESGMQEC